MDSKHYIYSGKSETVYIYIYIDIYMDFKHYIYSGKSETVYRYPKYIVLLAKPVQP